MGKYTTRENGIFFFAVMAGWNTNAVLYDFFLHKMDDARMDIIFLTLCLVMIVYLSGKPSGRLGQ